LQLAETSSCFKYGPDVAQGCNKEPASASPSRLHWGCRTAGARLGPWCCQGSTIPSLTEQPLPTAPSKASWARLGTVTRVGNGPSIPHCHCRPWAWPGRQPLGWDGTGLGSGWCLAQQGPGLERGVMCQSEPKRGFEEKGEPC